jgi:hypothetical protein
MKRAASLLSLALVLLVAACGSTTAKTATGKTYSARDVERAFFQAGVPFQQEFRRVANPYLESANENFGFFESGLTKAERKHLQVGIMANDSSTAAVRIAFVFDSAASVEVAVKARPLSKWLQSNKSVIRVRKLNVVILATGDSKIAQRVRQAITALR